MNNWWSEKKNNMSHWPTYVALMVDKLMYGMVEASKHFTNDKAVKENGMSALDNSLYLSPVRAFYCTLDKFEDYRKDKMAWYIIPDCVPEVLRKTKM